MGHWVAVGLRQNILGINESVSENGSRLLNGLEKAGRSLDLSLFTILLPPPCSSLKVPFIHVLFFLLDFICEKKYMMFAF